MNLQENFGNNNIEQNRRSYEGLEGPERIAAIALQIGSLAIAMDKVKRAPIVEHLGGVKGEIKTGTVREDNAQHSYMLGMLVKELISDPMLGEHFDHLSEIEAARYSDVHDLPEIITGDQRTYTTTLEDEIKKEEEERLAIEYLGQTIPFGMAADLKEYSLQERPAARYVRHIDKLLPLVVDYLGEGSDVIRDDYNVKNLEQHVENAEKSRERLRGMFSDEERGHSAIHGAYDILSALVTKELEASFASDEPEIGRTA